MIHAPAFATRTMAPLAVDVLALADDGPPRKIRIDVATLAEDVYWPGTSTNVPGVSMARVPPEICVLGVHKIVSATPPT